jgi:hypothetical protein
MPLAPADFAAYSRATGAPYPEDSEEMAQMAPAVLEFRRNQLKAPQQESNLLATIGTAALGLGALAGGALGARSLMRRGPQIPKGPNKSATAGVRQANLAEMAQVVRDVAAVPLKSTAFEPAPSKVVARSVMPTEQESFEVFNRQLQQAIPEPTAQEINFNNAPLRYTQGSPRFGYGKTYRPDPKDINEAILGPVSQELAEARRLDATQRLLTAAKQRQEDLGLTNQALGALQSGEDQMTGRIKNALQRNEDIDIGRIDLAEDQIKAQQGMALEQTTPSQLLGYAPDYAINAVASKLPDGLPLDQAEGGSRINALVEQGKRYLRAQEVDLDYDYTIENLAQTKQVNDRIARAVALKNTAEQIIQQELSGPSLVDTAREASGNQRAQLKAQGFAGEALERQLLQNMRGNFPEGQAVMQPLKEETARINRVGMPSEIQVRENIGSVEPLRQGDPERVSSPASQQAGYTGGIRGMRRVDYGLSTRNPKTGEFEELGGGIGVHGLEPKYASGAIRRRGEFGESDYGDLGYEYTAAAERRPTELTGRPGLEDLRNPYSKLSDDQLGELTMYGSDVDKYNAQEQLKKRSQVDVTKELRRLQLSNEPGASENFLTRFKQGLI